MCVTDSSGVRRYSTEAARKVQETYHWTESGRAWQVPGQRSEWLRYVAPSEVVSRLRQASETGTHSHAIHLRDQSAARSRTSPRLRHPAGSCRRRISGAADEWKVGDRVSRDSIWSPTTPLRHMAQLDGLRAFAVALLLCY